MNPWFLVAALVCGFTLVMHLVPGGRAAVRPLLDPELKMRKFPRYSNYFCWHIVSLTLAALTAAFAWSAMAGTNIDLAIAATLLSAAILAWNVTLNVWQKLPRHAAPQWVFFAPITILGLAGILP